MKGILREKEPLKAVLEVGDICYRISIPLSTYTKLPDLSETLFLYLSQVIREDSNTLYGFIAKEERDLFEVLITLSGIGPKTAIAIIGHMEMSLLESAILNSDIRILSKIPGIGKKTAEKLVIEMRDKFKGKKEKGGTHSLPSLGNNLVADAVGALMNLGYHPLDAQKAVQAIHKESPEMGDLGMLITAALKKI